MAGRRKSNPLGLPARVYFQSGAYRYRDLVGKWHLLGPRWDRAAKTNYVEASSENPLPGSMAELINRTLAKYGPDKSPRSRADNEAEAVNLKGFFGRMQPRAVSPVHVAQYRDARCDRHGKKAPVRANRELSLLSTVFAYGLEQGWCTVNPCRGVRRNKERPRTRNVEQVEYDGFLAFARARGTTARMLVATAVLTYLTSQRRQDILALRVSEIREDGIHVTQLKSGGKGSNRVDRCAAHRCNCCPGNRAAGGFHVPDLQSARTALHRLRLQVDVEPTTGGVARGRGHTLSLPRSARAIGRKT